MDNENIYDVVYSENNATEEHNTNEENNELKQEEIINENNSNNSENKPKKVKKNRGGFGKVVALVVSCSLLGGLAGSGLTYSMIKGNNSNSSSAGTYQNSNAKPINFVEDTSALTITDAFNKVAPAVVIVSTKGVQNYNGFFSQEVEGIGSGFIINEDGYILTNYHVIEGAQEVTVTLSDKRDVQAKVVNYDQNQDIAMLKIVDDSIKVPAVVELGDSDALQPGETVLAIGTPLSKDLSQTVTNGIVSAMNRNVETESGVKLNLIQTNTAINPGNSGGPLVNAKGQVIGINTMKMGGDAEGIGFAIPINDIKGKIDSLSKPILNLGVSIRTVDATLAKQVNLDEGLYVVEVTAFSPAEKAGIKAGDLIVKVDGNRVKTFDELKAIKDKKAEGDSIKIEFIRDGKTQSVDLVLTAQ